MLSLLLDPLNLVCLPLCPLLPIECSLVIRSTSDLPPMLSLSEVVLYDASNNILNLSAIYGHLLQDSNPGQVPYASMSR